MNNAIITTPFPDNEPVLSFAPGTAERRALRERIRSLKSEVVEIPVIVAGKEIRTGSTEEIHPPHELSHTLGTFHRANETETERAIQAAVAAQHDWARMHWTDRAAVFLRAAELLAGPWRATLNASTMLGQSKNPYQAEIDAACELIDFFRYNVYFAQQIYEEQTFSPPGAWNRMQYRPLEGFVLAITPFNFTSIAGNLPTAPAIMGNTVVWKPASSAIYSAYFIYRLLEEAGLPPGVINFVPGPGRAIGNPAFSSPHFAGLHFTGSTDTFQFMWQTIGQNISGYRAYPRVVGETGGKDFVIAHPSAHPAEVATAIIRGGFEYQGQKCSAVSRCYLPGNLWKEIRAELESQLSEIKMGPVDDFGNFFNAVIDRASYDKITGYITAAKEADGVEVVHGGGFFDEEGYFIEPTILKVEDPGYRTMCEEIFGPVVSVFVYDEDKYSETLKLVDVTSPYALTGAVFARDRRAIAEATTALEHSAGNFYINDKPTGAVVGQQPFGGARASGTNDKAGSVLNMIRWVSARAIKETFDPPRHFGYPFISSDD